MSASIEKQIEMAKKIVAQSVHIVNCGGVDCHDCPSSSCNNKSGDLCGQNEFYNKSVDDLLDAFKRFIAEHEPTPTAPVRKRLKRFHANRGFGRTAKAAGIEDHKWCDPDVDRIVLAPSSDGIVIQVNRHADSVLLDKADAIAIARHFGLID